jgi:hypothetical protein
MEDLKVMMVMVMVMMVVVEVVSSQLAAWNSVHHSLEIGLPEFPGVMEGRQVQESGHS